MQRRAFKGVLTGAWIVALALIVAISNSFAGKSKHFLGVADDQEQIIRFASAVEISALGFVPGQAVQLGDLLVEVRQPELDAELQIANERLQALKYGNRESRTSMESEIVHLQSELQARIAELDSDIEDLRVRKNAAESIMNGFDNGAESDGTSPIRDQIANLNVQKRALSRATAARINDLRSRLDTPERAIDAQIAELEKRREDVVRRQQELLVRAQLDGRIGSVLFQVGDTVPPYQPVLTVHGTRPSFVKGYIHENVVNDVVTGQTVWIRSVNSTRDEDWIEGVVEGLGSRIVEFPPRLKVNPMSQAWGREVVIEISRNNALLLGEKVSVQLEKPSRIGDVRALFAKAFDS